MDMPAAFIIVYNINSHIYFMSYSVHCVPFYDIRQQQYIKILCVNAAPTGALASRVRLIRPPRLSGLCDPNNAGRCIHAIMTAAGTAAPNANATATHMTPDDLPELFAFLMTNGYTVDTGLTKLAAKHQSSAAGALVCIISTTATTTTPTATQ
jgi:hypothetical protein